MLSHAQQAAEKALKAVYQYYGWSFRYTHDLQELVTGLKRQPLAVPEEVEEAAILTSFAWEARYPGLNEPVTEEEYHEAIHQAERWPNNWPETPTGSGYSLGGIPLSGSR